MQESERFRRVYEAEKRLRLHEAPDKKAADGKLMELALQEPAGRTIVFVELPEDAAQMAEKIEKTAGRGRVALLTGTMRGWERDQLAEKSLAFRSFQEPGQPSEATWLVATSAGEVGVNISGERLVTMLTESDHLLQRLGRLNRFGDQNGEPHRVGEAHVVYVPAKNPDKDGLTAQLNTLKYLQGLPVAGGGHDVSCRSLHEHPPEVETRSADPKTARLDEWQIDLWSQTTAGNAVVPAVEIWLHGQQDAKPQTEVAWREEVRFLVQPGVSPKDRDRALEVYRLLPHEHLSEPSNRVQSKLLELAGTCGEMCALFVSSDGETTVATVAALADNKFDLGYGTVLLPPGCGGLTAHGMFRSEASAEHPVYDVADALPGETRCRYLAEFDDEDGVWLWRRLGSSAESEEGPDPRNTKAVMARKRGLRRPLVIEVAGENSEEDGGTSRFLLFFGGAAKPTARRVEVKLDVHCLAVGRRAEALSNHLVGAKLSESFATAGRLHDQGKNEFWQRAMGGDVKTPLAKTAGGGSPLLLAGFRHELASLLVDSAQGADELALYLVGSHHGWGRPYWQPKAFDRKQPSKSQNAADAAIRRFGALQREWGPWGLAYLDAVFKAADGLVSSAEEEGEGE